MMRQANFYAANWPKGTSLGERQGLRLLPAQTTEDFGKPVLGGGEFVAAFSDQPEVQAFQTYLSTDTWANRRPRPRPTAAGSAPTRASTSPTSSAPSTSCRARSSRTRRPSSASTAPTRCGRRGRRVVLEADDRVDHRAKHHRDPREHRVLLEVGPTQGPAPSGRPPAPAPPPSATVRGPVVSTTEKLVQLAIVIALFLGVVIAVLVIADGSRHGAARGCRRRRSCCRPC